MPRKLFEFPRCFGDQTGLSAGIEKSRLRFFGIVVFVADPGHSPVNIGRLRFPQGVQQVVTVAGQSQRPLHRQPAEMGQPVQRRIEDVVGNALPVSFEQSRPLPLAGQALAQRASNECLEIRCRQSFWKSRFASRKFMTRQAGRPVESRCRFSMSRNAITSSAVSSE